MAEKQKIESPAKGKQLTESPAQVKQEELNQQVIAHPTHREVIIQEYIDKSIQLNKLLGELNKQLVQKKSPCSGTIDFPSMPIGELLMSRIVSKDLLEQQRKNK